MDLQDYQGKKLIEYKRLMLKEESKKKNVEITTAKWFPFRWVWLRMEVVYLSKMKTGFFIFIYFAKVELMLEVG